MASKTTKKSTASKGVKKVKKTTKSNIIKKKAMLAALEASMGIVTTACKNAKINRTTHYKWLKTDPDYREAVNELDELTKDFAESSLFRQIKEGIPASTIFFLKTKGKSRGYAEEVKVNVENVVTAKDFEQEEKWGLEKESIANCKKAQK